MIKIFHIQVKRKLRRWHCGATAVSASSPPPSPHSSHSTCVLRSIPTLGICVLERRARGQLLFYVVLEMTHFSRNLAELEVTREVMNGNHQKADEQGPTERCTVCHTVYPQCDTCSKYGRRGVHPLDQDKARNAHDNPGFTDDSGTQQSHWRKKMERVSAHQNIILTDKTKFGGMLLFRAILLSFFGSNSSVYLGTLPNHPRDPFNHAPGSLKVGHTESVVYCSCSCIRRPMK